MRSPGDIHPHHGSHQLSGYRDSHFHGPVHVLGRHGVLPDIPESGKAKDPAADSLQGMGELGVRWEILMAYSTVVVLPIVIVFICLQKYIVSGLTAGSVKG